MLRRATRAADAWLRGGEFRPDGGEKSCVMRPGNVPPLAFVPADTLSPAPIRGTFDGGGCSDGRRGRRIATRDKSRQRRTPWPPPRQWSSRPNSPLTFFFSFSSLFHRNEGGEGGGRCRRHDAVRGWGGGGEGRNSDGCPRTRRVWRTRCKKSSMRYKATGGRSAGEISFLRRRGEKRGGRENW